MMSTYKMDYEGSMHDVLERLLHDESAKPCVLPLSLLRAITNDFADAREIGRGAVAVVYKGVLRNGKVAVKKIMYHRLEPDELRFQNEVSCLMGSKHKNIVRLLGYCAESQSEMEDNEGEKMVLVENRQFTRSALGNVRSLLPVYRAITTVTLGDGVTTSYWHDVWDGDDSMADRFPELYGHCQLQEMTIKQASEGALRSSLVHGSSLAAQLQLSQAMQIVGQHQLRQAKDRRHSPLFKRNGDLDTSMLYKTLKTANLSPDPWAKFVWNNRAQPRVKFFAWLSQGRIQCKTNLVKKGIVENALCDVCHAADETPAHVIFGCASAKEFWDAIQIQTGVDWEVQRLQGIDPPIHVPSKHFGTFLLLCCWHIWKRRNNKVFRNDGTTICRALSACKSEASLWRARLPKKDREIADAWCSILVNAM